MNRIYRAIKACEHIADVLQRASPENDAYAEPFRRRANEWRAIAQANGRNAKL